MTSELTEEEFYKARRTLREKAYAQAVISSFLPKYDRNKSFEEQGIKYTVIDTKRAAELLGLAN